MNSVQWLQFALSYFLQATLVIGVAWGLERWTHAAESKTRIWAVCFVSLLGLLITGLLLPRLQWIHPWSHLGPSELLSVVSTEHWLGISLLASWVFGSCVLLARWVFRFVELRSFIRSCDQVTDGDDCRLRALADTELLRPNGRSVVFRLSPEDLGPFCYQFHQPFVFLPSSLIAGDGTELRHVLHHELTHLQTQHPLQLFAQQMAQVVLWFHPLVWISSRRASLVREFVCDDAASEQGASTVSYLRALLHIVENRSHPQNSTLSIGRSSSELKLRAQRLASASVRCASQWRLMPIASLLLAVAAASQAWLPTNPLASPATTYSPWPSWTAAALHTFDFIVRDYERYDDSLKIHELLEEHEELSNKSR